jgi:hypothetical protein
MRGRSSRSWAVKVVCQGASQPEEDVPEDLRRVPLLCVDSGVG